MNSFSEWFWGETEKSDRTNMGTYRSTEPVSVEEGRKLFNQAYKNRSSHSKHMDLSKKQKITLIPGSADSYKYRNRYDGNKIVTRGAIEFDLDGVDAGLGPVLASDDKRKLRIKAERLYRAYESEYENFLKADCFWEQLHKIKFDKESSYHDIFTEKVVGCSTPMWNTDKLAKYSDVINTAFYLAVKNKLCESLALQEKKTPKTPKESAIKTKRTKTTTKTVSNINVEDIGDESESAESAPRSLLEGYFNP